MDFVVIEEVSDRDEFPVNISDHRQEDIARAHTAYST